jgi:Tic22-like family
MMYKSSIGLIAVLGMSVALATVATAPVQALPEAQIVEKLQKVPVFTITNKTGNFLQQSLGKVPKASLVTPVYMDLKDAQLLLKKLKKESPQKAKVAQIAVVPLSLIYKLQLEAAKKPGSINFVFVPTDRQVKNAQRLLKTPLQFKTVPPVPIFMVAIKQQDRYATIQENNLTPLFFSNRQAQQWLDRVKQKDPKLAAKAEIKVNALQSILTDFQAKNYPEQQQFVLVPSIESIEDARKLQATQPNANATPTTAAPKK